MDLPLDASTSAVSPVNLGSAGQSPAALPLPALVFCRSRKRVEGVARELAGVLGWDRVGAYHAGLTKEERAAIEEWFFHAEDAVLVATCAYGMGVDKSNIRTVVHYDVPESVEAFLQESGRAGRDGEPARSVVLYNHADRTGADLVVDENRRTRSRQLLDYCTTGTCRRDYLMDALGAECEACFGCDHCRPDVYGHAGLTLDLDRAAAALWQFIWCNRRMLSLDQAVRISIGRPEGGDRWNVRRLVRPGCAPLEGWTATEAADLVDGLRSAGLIRVIRNGPWKRRITARPG